MIQPTRTNKSSQRAMTVLLRKSISQFIIGSNPLADLKIRSLDEVHISVMNDGGSWVLLCWGEDLITHNGKECRELKFDSSVEITVRGFKLRLIAEKAARVKKWTEYHSKSGSQAFTHQQIILKSHMQPERSYIIPMLTQFDYLEYGLTKALPEIKSGDWQHFRDGQVEISGRLVKTEELTKSKAAFFDRDTKKSIAQSVGLFTGLVLVIFLFSLNKKEQIDKKSEALIYDAKTIVLKKAESKKLAKESAQKSNPQQKEQKAASSNSSGGASAQAAGKAVASLKSSGVASIIARVASRAAKNVPQMAVGGFAANDINDNDTRISGRSLAQGVGKMGGNNGEKAGGRLIAMVGSGKGVGLGKSSSLTGKGVGKGDVGFLEEEAGIEGSGLDRDVIAQFIRDHLGEIRYCYERQLSAQSDLQGKVSVKFAIGGSGKVESVSIADTSMKSELVEGCMARQISKWKFPEPKGGVQVRVSYPFSFKAIQ